MSSKFVCHQKKVNKNRTILEFWINVNMFLMLRCQKNRAQFKLNTSTFLSVLQQAYKNGEGEGGIKEADRPTSSQHISYLYLNRGRGTDYTHHT